MKQVIITGLFSEDTGIAVLNRYRALAKSLECVEFIPTIISNLAQTKNTALLNNTKISSTQYILLSGTNDGHFSLRLQSRFFEWFFYLSMKNLDKKNIAAIIIPRNLLTLRLVVLNKLFWKLPLLVDCMEWHEYWQFKYGRFSLSYWRFLWSFHFIVPLAHGVLVTSNLLVKYFESRGSKVMRLIPQIDVSEFLEHQALYPNDTSLHLFYAGTPHKKDNLEIVLSALSALPLSKRSRIKFTIAGVSLSDVKTMALNCSIEWNNIEPQLRILGKIPRAQVTKELAKMDFLVLIRPNSRYSNAGFPSKITESLAAGTPVITNLTSDLNEFLQDLSNSIIVKDTSIFSIVAALEKALLLNQNELTNMHNQAKITALSYFDYHVMQLQLLKFLNSFNKNIL